MSWNNALPWWVYETHYEHDLAKTQCAFEEEIYSGVFKVTPDHVYYAHPSNFESWEPGGWNYEE
jgi:hypothetical protein